MEKLTFQQLKDKRSEWTSAVIVFTENSFNKRYSLESRSYRLTENDMWGLDDTNQSVRLDYYMFGHDNPKNNWKVEYCYIETEE